jgi:hypothetical protein
MKTEILDVHYEEVDDKRSCYLETLPWVVYLLFLLWIL